jgi:hypothetical protein
VLHTDAGRAGARLALLKAEGFNTADAMDDAFLDRYGDAAAHRAA